MIITSHCFLCGKEIDTPIVTCDTVHGGRILHFCSDVCRENQIGGKRLRRYLRFPQSRRTHKNALSDCFYQPRSLNTTTPCHLCGETVIHGIKYKHQMRSKRKHDNYYKMDVWFCSSACFEKHAELEHSADWRKHI